MKNVLSLILSLFLTHVALSHGVTGTGNEDGNSPDPRTEATACGEEEDEGACQEDSKLNATAENETSAGLIDKLLKYILGKSSSSKCQEAMAWKSSKYHVFQLENIDVELPDTESETKRVKTAVSELLDVYHIQRSTVMSMR